MYERQDHVDQHRTLLPFQETKAAVGQVHAPLSKKPQTVGRPTLAPPKGEMPSRTQGPHYGRPIPPTGRNARPDAAPAHVGPSLHVRGCRTWGCLARSPLSSLLAHRKRNASTQRNQRGRGGKPEPTARTTHRNAVGQGGRRKTPAAAA